MTLARYRAYMAALTNLYKILFWKIWRKQSNWKTWLLLTICLIGGFLAPLHGGSSKLKSVLRSVYLLFINSSSMKGYCVVQSRKNQPTFRICLQPPSSGLCPNCGDRHFQKSVNIYDVAGRSIPEGYVHTGLREYLKSHPNVTFSDISACHPCCPKWIL
jgi:hypothetical protein